MADLLTRSDRSLIRQSYDARERLEPLNGDGFGVGWYAPGSDPVPAVFTSVSPAWSNRNLHRLAEKIRSGCFFAHVRATTRGSLVNEINCHPFQFGRYMWMHNGSIAEFRKIKRRLRASLTDDAYEAVQGTTDSEHAFAVFLNLLGDCDTPKTTAQLARTLRDTLHLIMEYTGEAGINHPCYLNFAVTDGESIIISRAVNQPGVTPPSLYVSRGERFECRNNEYRMKATTSERPAAIIIASEPLTEYREDWELVPENHILAITPEHDLLYSSL
ncbi:MAG: class II glutamine amidotransferase [Granulosicoccaceae bacterium]